MAFSVSSECKRVWVQACWNLVIDVLEIQFLRALMLTLETRYNRFSVVAVLRRKGMVSF